MFVTGNTPSGVRKIITCGEIEQEEIDAMSFIGHEEVVNLRGGWLKKVTRFVRANAFAILILILCLFLVFRCFRSSCFVTEWITKIKKKFDCSIIYFNESEQRQDHKIENIHLEANVEPLIGNSDSRINNGEFPNQTPEEPADEEYWLNNFQTYKMIAEKIIDYKD